MRGETPNARRRDGWRFDARVANFAGGGSSKDETQGRRLKVLELFSGTRSIGKAFERRGHEVYSVDWDTQFEANWYTDIERVKADEVLKRFGRPDVCWLSPDCSSYSIAAISKHRRKNMETGVLDPVSDYARKCDRVNLNCMRLLRDLQPALFFIENPRGGMRHMQWLQVIPRNTVTYCAYQRSLPPELRRMKPTDLFSNHPNPRFRPMCKNGDPCHARAPRGSKAGTQGLKLVDRYRIPDDLCDYIVTISEDYIYRLDKANEYLVGEGLEPITPHWGEDGHEPPAGEQLEFFTGKGTHG